MLSMYIFMYLHITCASCKRARNMDYLWDVALWCGGLVSVQLHFLNLLMVIIHTLYIRKQRSSLP